MTYVRWKAENDFGLEHLVLRTDIDDIEIDSVVIGNRFTPYGARYHLRCAADWSVRLVEIDVVGGALLRLTADGLGNWFDSMGVAIPALEGCIDVDISSTPFTNTLPIRRLGLVRGERRELQVVYVPLPNLKLAVTTQAYTCLEPGQRYRYEGLFRAFEAELEVDADGLVLNYPGLFKRAV